MDLEAILPSAQLLSRLPSSTLCRTSPVFGSSSLVLASQDASENFLRVQVHFALCPRLVVRAAAL